MGIVLDLARGWVLVGLDLVLELIAFWVSWARYVCDSVVL